MTGDGGLSAREFIDESGTGVKWLDLAITIVGVLAVAIGLGFSTIYTVFVWTTSRLLTAPGAFLWDLGQSFIDMAWTLATTAWSQATNFMFRPFNGIYAVSLVVLFLLILRWGDDR